MNLTLRRTSTLLFALCALSARAIWAQPAVVSIPQIQGLGSQSPYEDKAVSTEGVVTGDFQEKHQLKGFFIQDPKGDDDTRTSDGLFVYVVLGNKFSAVDVKPGDRVRISGTIDEDGQNTQLEDPTEITILGREAVPAPTAVTLPAPAGQSLEQYEGMLVTIPQTLTVTDNYHLKEMGQLLLTAGGRMMHPGMAPAGSPSNEESGGMPSPSRWIMLDDGETPHNPVPVPFLNAQGTRRVGDTVAGLTGMVTYDGGEYCIQPTVAPSFADSNPRTAAPAAVGGNLKIASFNVMNYFTTLRKDNKLSRGAETDAQFARQSTKTVATLKALDADVVGIMEMQNNGTTAIDDLVKKLNAAYKSETYASVPIPPQGLGSDLIRVAMIYKPAKVKPLGAPVTDVAPAYDRFPLAQRFALVANPKSTFLVIGNHLKSRSISQHDNTPDSEMGSGAWNRKRVLQAQTMVLFVKKLQKDLAEPRALILGDFNAYAAESPLRAVKAEGFEALEDGIAPEQRYSFIFAGRSGSIDHALASPALKPLLTGISIWHVNCDEPEYLSYSNPEATAEANRSSDHDPVVMGFNLN